MYAAHICEDCDVVVVVVVAAVADDEPRTTYVKQSFNVSIFIRCDVVVT